jgi:hypothetical protein
MTLAPQVALRQWLLWSAKKAHENQKFKKKEEAIQKKMQCRKRVADAMMNLNDRRKESAKKKIYWCVLLHRKHGLRR